MVDWKAIQQKYAPILAIVFLLVVAVIAVAPSETGYLSFGKFSFLKSKAMTGPSQIVLTTPVSTSASPKETLIVTTSRNAAEINEIVDFIKSNKGQISVVLLPNSLIVQDIDSNLQNKIVSKFGTRIRGFYTNKVTDTSILRSTSYAIPLSFWNSKFEPQKSYIPSSDSTLVSVHADNVGLLGGERPHKCTVPSKFYTTGYMVGDVYVSVILPDSNGQVDPNTENWADSEVQTIYNEIVAALDWWAKQKPSTAQLTFFVDAPKKVPTKYEPITRSTTDRCPWVNDIFDYFSTPYSGGSCIERVVMYNDLMRDKQKTDWAFTIFVADSSNDADGSFPNMLDASADNSYVLMTSKSTLAGVVAHEIGHVFRAQDQYSRPNHLCTDKSGLLQVENQNLKEVGCTSNVPSIMRSVLANGIDPYGAGQIGWRDADKDGINDAIDSTYNPASDSDRDGIVDYWDSDAGTIVSSCVDVITPILTVTHAPQNPKVGDTVHITATGKAFGIKIDEITLFIDGNVVNKCKINQESGSCSYQTWYNSAGEHSYVATLSLTSGSRVNVPTSKFTVSPAGGGGGGGGGCVKKPCTVIQ